MIWSLLTPPTRDHNLLLALPRLSQTSLLSVPPTFYVVSLQSWDLQTELESVTREPILYPLWPALLSFSCSSCALTLHITFLRGPQTRAQCPRQSPLLLLQLYTSSHARVSSLLKINSGHKSYVCLIPGWGHQHPIPSFQEALNKYLLNEVPKKGKDKNHMNFML